MKKIFKKLIIYLCRKDYTLDKIRKYNLYSIFIFIFLLLSIGISWQFTPKFSIHINLIIWWTLVLLQNANTLLFYLYRKNIYKVCDEYVTELCKEKNVTVGYPDSKFTVGQVFKIENDDKNLTFRILGRRYQQPREGVFTGYFAGMEAIAPEKVFKFVSSQKNRKMKLQKLANLTK